MAPAEVWATLLDEGVYLGSLSTFYRLLRQAGETRERRRQATHPATVKPELVADRAEPVWSWDITKLRGPAKWTYYYLYVILDIYSRYVVGWMVATRESAALAEVLIRQTCAKQGIGADQLTIHADRGSSMTSKPVAFLLADLGVTQSHSRPHVSDDNPFSEAQFKTLKYRPDFPDRFDSIEAARLHCQTFFAWYNDEHHHSGLGLHTPADVHYGTAEAVRDEARRRPRPPPTPPTPNGSSASRPSHRNCPPAPGSTHPTTPRRPLSKYRSNGASFRLTDSVARRTLDIMTNPRDTGCGGHAQRRVVWSRRDCAGCQGWPADATNHWRGFTYDGLAQHASREQGGGHRPISAANVMLSMDERQRR